MTPPSSSATPARLSLVGALRPRAPTTTPWSRATTALLEPGAFSTGASNLNVADVLLADNSTAEAGDGSFNIATIIYGAGEQAIASTGSTDLAMVYGFFGDGLEAIATGSGVVATAPQASIRLIGRAASAAPCRRGCPC